MFTYLFKGNNYWVILQQCYAVHCSEICVCVHSAIGQCVLCYFVFVLALRCRGLGLGLGLGLGSGVFTTSC